jgi:hypothetical protein
MSEWLTQGTWRPGKRRRTYARVKHSGGATEAPLAFLAAAAVSGFGSGKHRTCTHVRRDGSRCKGWAMKGLPVCTMHRGAALTAISVRPYIGRSGKVTIPRKARKAVRKL